MHIKSNSKQHTIRKWLTDKSEQLNDITSWIRVSIVLILSVVANYMWAYSGMLSVLIFLSGFIIVAKTENEVTLTERFFFFVGVCFIILLFGNSNTYSKHKDNIDVKYSKVVFTDATEKLIIFMTYPKKETVVLSKLPTADYYSLKEEKNNLKFVISETGRYAHWYKLAYNGNPPDNTIGEWDYDLNISSPSFSIVITEWRSNQKERLFIKKEKK